jgi:acetylglutamate kinase
MHTSSSPNANDLLKRYPELGAHRDKSYLVKYGGAAMESADVRQAVCAEIAILSALGIRLVVVHGGGKEISRMLERLAIPSSFVDGLRVTNADAMSATEMILSGAVNKDLASRITRCGALAIGLSGRDARILEGTILKTSSGADLGLVGEVVRCNTAPIRAILDAGYIPVVSPVAETSDGTPLNVNADYAAAALAGALGVSGCIFLTDVDGVMRSGVVEPSLTVAVIEELISVGIISGGMIPKVRCATQALRAGCEQATICNASKPEIVSQAITRAPGSGTAVMSLS